MSSRIGRYFFLLTPAAFSLASFGGCSNGNSPPSNPQDSGTVALIPEAGTNVTPDGNVTVDSSTAPPTSVDAQADAELLSDGGDDAGLAPIVPLALCSTLDRIWGLSPGGDRASAWGRDIAQQFANGLVNDCRINNIALSLSNDQQVDYINLLIGWTVSFMGCPDSPDAGVVSDFGPAENGTSHVFTTADLALLSTLYAAGVDVAVAAELTSNPDAGAAPLTTSDEAAIRTLLAQLAARVPGVVSSPVYSYNSCSDDGGAEDAASE
jgi:hypothetical protein